MPCNTKLFYFIRYRVILLSVVILAMIGRGAGEEDLQKGFAVPPASARPWVYWFWLNGNITREGITADLEAMARVGIGGAQIFNGGHHPHGPVQFNSPEWQDIVRFTAKEAWRLGLELCISNCGGWDSAGGPWNTPDHGMKMLVTSEKQVKGPSHFDGRVPQPPTKLDWYRDIAVLAFRTPSGENTRMCDAAPDVTVSGGTKDGFKEDNCYQATLKRPTLLSPVFLQFAFAKPFTAQTLKLYVPGRHWWEDYQGKLEASEDGKNFQPVREFSMKFNPSSKTLGFDQVSAKVFRIVFTGSQDALIGVVRAELSPKLGVDDFMAKTFATRDDSRYLPPSKVRLSTFASSDKVPADAVVHGDKTVNLTERTAADGQLAWDVPEGDWTLLRVGYTLTGSENSPAPIEGTGLECDKLSKEAAQAHWDGSMGPLLAKLGPFAGDVKSGLNTVMIDSYLRGSQNWTQGFDKQFQKRCGYDLTRFLPVFSNRVVDNPEATERFLWDFRRTVADMFAENYSGKFAEMAHRAGLKYSVEPYGDGPFDDLQYGSYADIPLCEFWAGGDDFVNMKFAASLGHVFGRRFIGAEAFTADPDNGKWQRDPFSLKARGDAVYCAGVNRIIIHCYAHQPWTHPTRYPGMTMGQWGIHFTRTTTWWEQGKAWILYQTRCQYLLQQGRFVADVCFYCGADAPNGMVGGGLPQGYDYDACETGALMSMSVKNGRVVLPSGMSYRVLALPDNRAMTPTVLRKVAELVKAGAVIVGPKPEHSPSLTGYPACDAEVKKTADAIWSNGVLAKSPSEALAALNVQPDFTCKPQGASIRYIHRATEEADIYFVSNQKQVSDAVECTFRVSGKIPELWHPDTGVMEKAPVFVEKDERTTIPLRFDKAGSVFVVFRQPAKNGDHAVAIRCTSPDYKLAVKDSGDGVEKLEIEAWKSGSFEVSMASGKTLKAAAADVPEPFKITDTWDLHFPPNWGAPEKVTLDKLSSWTEHPNPGVRYFSGTAVYRKTFVWASAKLQGERHLLDLGALKNIAEVELNGHSLGILWKPPYRVDITDVLKQGDNALAVKITNLWPNRLIGDEQLPEDREWVGKQLKAWPQWVLDGKPSPTGRFTFTTWHHWTKDDKPLPSGLFGPVLISTAKTLEPK